MDTFTAILGSLGKVGAISLILGAGIPLVFAYGVRFWSMETAPAGAGQPAGRNQLGQALGILCFGIVSVAVIVGILYVSRDFIGHQFDLYILGAKKK